jgi:transketolase
MDLLSKSFDVTQSRFRCSQYRQRILNISQKVSALHIGGSFSSIEIVDVIYYGFIRNPNSLHSPDIFIMSKGHSCLSQYAVLESLGIIRHEDFDLYCKSNGYIGVHPDRGNPGIHASTGSLGHGLAIAIGMAYAEIINKRNGIVYVVISDGELQEGSTWEALMLAANLNLKNIIVFLDHNGFQSFGKTSLTHPAFYPIKDKIQAFGWEYIEVNGHDSSEMFEKIKSEIGQKPVFVCANTTKGKGVSFMENNPIWHYRSPDLAEYAQALVEVSNFLA